MENTDSTDCKNDGIETGSWNRRRAPQTLIFNYKPFLLQYAVAQWMACKNLCWLKSRIIQIWRSHSWDTDDPPEFLLAWQTVQNKLTLCSVYRRIPRFKPRLLSLTCSELKQNVNSESTGNIMGFDQMRHIATDTLLMHATADFTSATKANQTWIKSGSAGQLVVFLSGNWTWSYSCRLPTCLPARYKHVQLSSRVAWFKIVSKAVFRGESGCKEQI